MNLEMALGFVVVALAAAGLVYISSKNARSNPSWRLRRVDAIARLKSAINLSVEDGSRVHLSLGNADLTEATNPSALVGLETLHQIGQSSSASDQPPVCTSGNGAFALLSKDTLSAVATETNTHDISDPDQARLSGVTSLGFAIGAMEVVSDPGVKANVLIGNFGPEAGFFTVTSEGKGAFIAGSSDSLVGQSVFLATTRDAVLGEELFSIPAHLTRRPAYLASLRVQDILRFILVIALAIGALLKVVGAL